MAKLSVGRLRPNFLSVCNVTYASLKCTPGRYVPPLDCKQTNLKMVEEARCVEHVNEIIGLVYQRGGVQLFDSVNV